MKDVVQVYFEFERIPVKPIVESTLVLLYINCSLTRVQFHLTTGN